MIYTSLTTVPKRINLWDSMLDDLNAYNLKKSQESQG